MFILFITYHECYFMNLWTSYLRRNDLDQLVHLMLVDYAN